jgi:hypothetical protein
MNTHPNASWTRYLLAASGTAALTASTATAAVVYWNPSDQTVNIEETASFNMLTGAVSPGGSADAGSFLLVNESSNHVFMNGTTSRANAFAVGTAGSRLGKLSEGDAISDSNDFALGEYPEFEFEDGSDYPWNDGGTGYVGLRFDIAGQTHYGWAQFTYDDAADTLTLLDFAYENTAGASILAGNTGVIPEPGSAALLMALASGAVAAYRRRRHDLAS